MELNGVNGSSMCAYVGSSLYGCVLLCVGLHVSTHSKKKKSIIHLETLYHFEFHVLWYNLKGSLIKRKPVFVGKIIQCRQSVAKTIQNYL
jgi:hypothetical protein